MNRTGHVKGTYGKSHLTIEENYHETKATYKTSVRKNKKEKYKINEKTNYVYMEITK